MERWPAVVRPHRQLLVAGWHHKSAAFLSELDVFACRLVHHYKPRLLWCSHGGA